MLDKTDWADLIPHAGGMCLLDTVVAWNAGSIHARSDGHRDPANPLRREGHLHAVHLAEYGAQASAVHGALQARAAGGGPPRPGMLVSLRDLRLARERIDDLSGSLDVHADCLYADDAGAQYSFRIEHAGSVIASGRVAVLFAAGGDAGAADGDAWPGRGPAC
ncbi:MAG TPA: phosphotransferase [Rhodanobacteraceae bacterium]|nr:phosphotransferase [Rhodanobacteraceae bacterium]